VDRKKLGYGKWLDHRSSSWAGAMMRRSLACKLDAMLSSFPARKISASFHSRLRPLVDP
jgi:hypothetical protein